ncbi:MAG: hypothetical protein F4103_12155 [Boseongicola sp. SB0673_bin_14]|nr:hypothetical protein [Boseongicola sp. SB0667_bin_21]MYI69450.1 hypothetical protein [Boseongicola sp. SB0673_bin_14]
MFEHALPDGTQADYVHCDRQGRPMAALEAKWPSIDPVRALDRGRHYAERLGAPFVFLSNGEEVRFRDQEAAAIHATRMVISDPDRRLRRGWPGFRKQRMARDPVLSATLQRCSWSMSVKPVCPLPVGHPWRSCAVSFHAVRPPCLARKSGKELPHLGILLNPRAKL